MLRAYTNGGHCTRTLELYLLMQRTGVPPNNYTFPFVLKACASQSLSLQGKLVHGGAIRTGFDSETYVMAALVDMYAKCGLIDDGRKVFDGMSIRDLVCWTAMITAYEQAERAHDALVLLDKMQQEGLSMDSVAAVSISSAIGQLGDGKMAESVHAYVICSAFLQDVCVGNAIIAMYAKCGDVEKARIVFDCMEERDVISWNSMLSAYTQNGLASEALLLFDQLQASSAKPNPVTALIMVSACAYLGSRQHGRRLHRVIVDSKVELDVTLRNAIMDMYTKCGDLDTAVELFKNSDPGGRNVSSWNVMISGYGMHGSAKEALELFSKMVKEGVRPNHITFTSILSACSHAGLINEGRKWFADMPKFSVIPEAKHYACMVDMLGRAGLLHEAYDLIRQMPSHPNDGVWGALLLACRIHGNTELGDAGLINEGRKWFADMPKFSVIPEAKHYACMVDMLGRAGLLHEAYDLIRQMPSHPNDGVWGALLLACRIHGNTELGELAANNLFQLEPHHAGYYVLMSNLYAASSKWQEVGELRQDMKTRGLRKTAAFSVIEFGEEVHGFHASDHMNPYWREVYRKVERLAIEMKMAGYVPDHSCVLHDVEEEDKEHILSYHSEKLAVAFGLMKIEPGIEIHVTKNLRVCNDCHLAFKFVSHIYGRKIVIRDANRFHHFQGGLCSCKDYW